MGTVRSVYLLQDVRTIEETHPAPTSTYVSLTPSVEVPARQMPNLSLASTLSRFVLSNANARQSHESSTSPSEFVRATVRYSAAAVTPDIVHTTKQPDTQHVLRPVLVQKTKG